MKFGLIPIRDTKSEDPPSKKGSLSFVNGYYHIDHEIYSKRNKTLSNNESNNDQDALIEDLTNQALEIVKGINPLGMIRIPEDHVIPYFKDKKDLEDDLLIKVFTLVSKSTGIEVDVIKHLLRDRIEIV